MELKIHPDSTPSAKASGYPSRHPKFRAFPIVGPKIPQRKTDRTVTKSETKFGRKRVSRGLFRRPRNGGSFFDEDDE